MIIDCHCHIYPDRAALGGAAAFSCLIDKPDRTGTDGLLNDASEGADRVIIQGFSCRAMQAHIDPAWLTEQVAKDPQRRLAFAGIDPNEKHAAGSIATLKDQGFVGITIAPACQGLHPCHSRLMAVYEAAASCSMPVYVLQGIALPPSGQLAYTQTHWYDEVLQTFGHLKLIISHMGWPCIEQTIALLAKHRNVFADIAGLANHSTLAYRVLSMASQCGVDGQLLFASDFPTSTVRQTVEALYKLTRTAPDTLLAPVPAQVVRSLIARESLSLLQIP